MDCEPQGKESFLRLLEVLHGFPADRNNIGEEGFVFLMVLEGSVHVHLEPCISAEHHGSERVWQRVLQIG